MLTVVPRYPQYQPSSSVGVYRSPTTPSSIQHPHFFSQQQGEPSGEPPRKRRATMPVARISSPPESSRILPALTPSSPLAKPPRTLPPNQPDGLSDSQPAIRPGNPFSSTTHPSSNSTNPETNTYDPMFSVAAFDADSPRPSLQGPPTPRHPSLAQQHIQTSLQRSSSTNALSSTAPEADVDNDPFLNLLEQLAENEQSRGGPSELDFFLSNG